MQWKKIKRSIYYIACWHQPAQTGTTDQYFSVSATSTVFFEIHGKGLPSFQADQGIFNSFLIVLCHVKVHIWVVVSDIPLCTPIWDRSKSKRRWIIIWPLKLERGKTKCFKHPKCEEGWCQIRKKIYWGSGLKFLLGKCCGLIHLYYTRNRLHADWTYRNIYIQHKNNSVLPLKCDFLPCTVTWQDSRNWSRMILEDVPYLPTPPWRTQTTSKHTGKQQSEESSILLTAISHVHLTRDMVGPQTKKAKVSLHYLIGNCSRGVQVITGSSHAVWGLPFLPSLWFMGNKNSCIFPRAQQLHHLTQKELL